VVITKDSDYSSFITDGKFSEEYFKYLELKKQGRLNDLPVFDDEKLTKQNKRNTSKRKKEPCGKLKYKSMWRQ
jgi:hypothetical protein